MCFGMLIGTTYGHLSLLPLIREKVLFLVKNQFHKFLRNAGLYLTARNPLRVQAEPISGYLDRL